MARAARYAKSGDVHIAYVVVGDGPLDIVWVPTTLSQIEHLFEEPTIAAALERIGTFARLVTFDRRGSGLSDPVLGVPTLEEQMDDVLAVMEAVGSERAAVFGTLEGGPMATMFAATHPDRTTALVLYASFARTTPAEDYDFPPSPEERELRMVKSAEHWGEGLVASAIAPSRAHDPEFMEWAARLERLAVSPGTARKIFDFMGDLDVRHVLPSVRVPTLVMHRRDDSFMMVQHSRYIAKRIPGARYVELEGSDNLFSVGDSESVIGEIEEFLTGERHVREPDRMLATVLFTDIVDSTRRAAQLGDAAWRRLLEDHDVIFRRSLQRHRGREVKRTGDGFLATFDGPARAIRCAEEVADAVRSLGIDVRAGLHTGECEIMNGDVGGLAVHIGARVMARAGPGEVLVSSTVKDLVVGSGIDFQERGSHDLKGVPGEWRLFAVA
jgi:class 3 adenylate cyclase/alpha-beta hydrolase superfamily lysophospholipase